MASSWISYNELAWTEDFLADPQEYEDEINEYIEGDMRTIRLNRKF